MAFPSHCHRYVMRHCKKRVWKGFRKYKSRQKTIYTKTIYGSALQRGRIIYIYIISIPLCISISMFISVNICIYLYLYLPLYVYMSYIYNYIILFMMTPTNQNLAHAVEDVQDLAGLISRQACVHVVR